MSRRPLGPMSMLARVSSRLKFAESSSATSTTKLAQGTSKGSSAEPARSSIVNCRRMQRPANRRATLLCSMLQPTMLRMRSGYFTTRNTWACVSKSVWTRNRLPLACLLPALPDPQAPPTLTELPSRVATALTRSLPMAAAVKLASFGNNLRSSARGPMHLSYCKITNDILVPSRCNQFVLNLLPLANGLIPASTNEQGVCSSASHLIDPAWCYIWWFTSQLTRCAHACLGCGSTADIVTGRGSGFERLSTARLRLESWTVHLKDCW